MGRCDWGWFSQRGLASVLGDGRTYDRGLWVFGLESTANVHHSKLSVLDSVVVVV